MPKGQGKYRTIQLGQLRPANTTAATVFSPTERDRYIVVNVIVCNVTAGAVTYRLFVDADGKVYDEDSAIAWDITLPANTSDLWEVELYLNDPASGLGVRSSSGDAINFIVNGYDGSL